MNKRLTISEIARMAGVSTATVSRYLNGHFDKMSDETRTKVQQIISDTNYHINLQAQSLKNQTTHLIGMVVADIENIFSSILFKGSDKVFEQHGYQILLMNSDNSIKREHNQLQRLLDLQVDGIILQPISTDPKNYEFIRIADTPIVIVDRKINQENWPEVSTDNYGYSKVLSELIIRMGYKRIITISEPLSDNEVRMDRYQAVQDAAKGTNVIVDRIEIDTETTDDFIYSQIMKKTDALKSKSVIYALKGTVLMRVRKLLSKFHILIPKDIGVTAFDDWDWAQLMQPQITTIQQNPKKMGEKSAEILINILSGNPLSQKTVLVESELKIRNSLID
ncbi:LacI family DNA-binding transcriptional regulator [Lentilactobacillus parabuchneri]|jgi:LacI family transcriptional regulator, kdg operon repressor|nr:LacI family DNA-binding transcriptional regulator [Lentilactobacillus parabuchneri]APR07188.1 HTH-type transcriptional regulator KdgR [Lentilactobacillus parabuchneri]MBW0222787.1 LacI family DNA-binding transcriptional regulator [Lentilactobacillus parabuchneri]MBW0245237.1 LacI family DNA-binding transcriptional regulator [Lentilactobacillus parabuchneri]MBW0264867.1 LacI family DNA-binding transcriptional regulator [Lentilactobacillus parabuchneri]MDG9736443.1 LacI family DNA-binding tra